MTLEEPCCRVDWQSHKDLIKCEMAEDKRYGYYFAVIPIKRLYVSMQYRWDYLRVNGDL